MTYQELPKAPTEMLLDEPLLPREHRWLGKVGNSNYIPSWYREHRLNAEVTQDGQPLGFRIAQVLVWRRWAVQETGELMPQLEFEREYKRYLTGWAVASNFDPNLKHIPNVRAFVATKMLGDHYVDMAFNPDLRASKPIEAKYNQEGELSEHYLREQKQDTERLSKMETLAKLLASGAITQEVFLRESGLATNALEVATVAAPSSSPEPEPQPAREPASKRRGGKGKLQNFELVDAKCGKQVQAPYLKQHTRMCKACRGLPLVLPSEREAG